MAPCASEGTRVDWYAFYVQRFFSCHPLFLIFVSFFPRRVALRLSGMARFAKCPPCVLFSTGGILNDVGLAWNCVFTLPFCRILRVSRFAVLQMFSPDEQAGETGSASAAGAAKVPGSRVVDILAEGLEGNWTPATHLKIIKVGDRGSPVLVHGLAQTSLKK